MCCVIMVYLQTKASIFIIYMYFFGYGGLHVVLSTPNISICFIPAHSHDFHFMTIL